MNSNIPKSMVGAFVRASQEARTAAASAGVSPGLQVPAATPELLSLKSPSNLRSNVVTASTPDFDALRKRAFNLRWAECAPDVIPLTAADPDLPVSSVVTQAIARYVATPHLPYGPPAGLVEFRQALASHFARTKSADIDPSRVIATNSAASAIVLVAREVLKAGDEVVVQDPVDFLVAESVRRAGATLRFWKPTDGRFTIEGLKEALTPNTRALFVCHPHNPLGALWTPSEVRAIAAEANERGIKIVSDEVWSDVVLDGRPFRSFAAHGEDECHAWVIHGMSKGFALAGLRIGAVIAPDRKAADTFIQTQGFAQTIEGAATLSQIAAIAALRDTTAWRPAFLEHCGRMRDHAMRRLARLKGVSMDRAPEATFVLFANIAETGIPEEELARRIEHVARVRVVPGSPRWFGQSAAGHLRLSLATTREVLDEAIDRISQEWKTILKGA
ncbi:MAG: hypothetical protein RL591_1268 [Planctomycetota bacterium]|jgi:aspartate/methionine/tyrosine aminotransferase